MKISDITFQFCVTSVKFELLDLDKQSNAHQPHLSLTFGKNCIYVWVDEKKLGFVSRKDTPFVRSVWKGMMPKYKRITKWSIVTKKKPYYTIIEARLQSCDTFKYHIYQLTFGNSETEKETYIGSSSQVGYRLQTHRTHLIKKMHCNKRMQEAFDNNNNNETFDSKIIASGYASTKSDQFQCEQLWINKLHPSLNLVNAYVGKETITCDGCGKKLQQSSLDGHYKSKYHKSRVQM